MRSQEILREQIKPKGRKSDALGYPRNARSEVATIVKLRL
jgi:hypothetical protein